MLEVSANTPVEPQITYHRAPLPPIYGNDRVGPSITAENLPPSYAGACQPFLHPFNHLNIFGKYGAPHRAVGGAHISVFFSCCVRLCIIKLNLFKGFFGPVRCQDNGKIVIAMHSKQDIWK